MPATSPPVDGRALPAPYLGPVATRLFVPNTAIAPGTATWAMSRSMHWTRDTCSQFIILIPTYSVDLNYAETSVASLTAKASLEYNGTIYQSVEGSSSAVNGYITQTFNLPISIPANRQIWVRILQQGANGVVYNQRNVLDSFAAGEGFFYGTGAATDMTVSGTVTKSFQGRQGMFPAAILGMTRKRTFAIVGTSIEFGIDDKVSDNYGDLGTFGRVVGPGYAYINMAYATSKLASWNAATRTFQDQLIAYVSDIINAHGINDIGAGDTAATLAGRRTTFAALYPTKTVTGSTLMPNTTSTSTAVSITGLTKTTSGSAVATATVVTSAILTVGQIVNIAGVTGQSNDIYNGPKVVATIPDGTHFTYAIPSDTSIATTAAGTITYNDAWSTAAQQTSTSAGNTALAFNILERAGISGEQLFLDLAVAVDPYRTGKWGVSLDPSATTGTAAFMTRDGLHPLPSANEIIRDRTAATLARLSGGI